MITIRVFSTRKIIFDLFIIVSVYKFRRPILLVERQNERALTVFLLLTPRSREDRPGRGPRMRIVCTYINCDQRDKVHRRDAKCYLS